MSRPSNSATDPALQRVVARALAEDLGESGDLSGLFAVEEATRAQAALVAREAAVVSGTGAVTETFARLDPAVTVQIHLPDGATIGPGDRIATVTGQARSVLAGERVALNLLGRLSGVATTTAAYVERVDDTGVRIVDTRKTTPGLRALEKQAVLHGGGVNHRFGLFDAVMVKDNHLALGGGVHAVLARLAAAPRHLLAVEIEVDTLDQLSQVLDFEAARISRGERPIVHTVMLDNFTPEQVRQGVQQVRSHAAPLVIEVSGGVNLDTVRDLALAGPDLISVGALTHSPRCVDIGLDL